MKRKKNAVQRKKELKNIGQEGEDRSNIPNISNLG